MKSEKFLNKLGLIFLGSVLNLAIFFSVGVVYAISSNWAEPPAGEVKGGKFMNLLNSIMREEAVWDGTGTLTSSTTVRHASDLVNYNDLVVAELGTSTNGTYGLKTNKLATGAYGLSDTHDITTPSLYANDADFTTIEEDGVAVLNQTEADARYLQDGVNVIGDTQMIDNPSFSTVTVGSTTPTADNQLASKAYVDANAGGDEIPIGAIMAFDLTSCPSGWSELTSARGRVIVGLNPSDSSFNSKGETGGEKTHTLSIAEMPSHNHGLRHTYLGWGIYPYGLGGGGSAGWENQGVSTTNTGSGQAHNNLQPYISFIYCRKN